MVMLKLSWEAQIIMMVFLSVIVQVVIKCLFLQRCIYIRNAISIMIEINFIVLFHVLTNEMIDIVQFAGKSL